MRAEVLRTIPFPALRINYDAPLGSSGDVKENLTLKGDLPICPDRTVQDACFHPGLSKWATQEGKIPPRDGGLPMT